jgi:hypothetical protein
MGAEMTVQPGGAAAEQFLLQVGDIGVSSHWVVTPNGTAPLRGSQWIVQDQTTTIRRIPPWAIVCAVIFFLLCLVGLLFLLVQETTIQGYVTVSVRSGDLVHSTQLPISSQVQIAQARAQVAQAQSMAARA